MSFEALYSKYAQGRTFWLVVHLQKPALALAVSETMLERVQLPSANADIVVDLHAPGIMLAISPTKVLTVTVQHLSFQLDCKGPVKLIDNPALRFQLQISIEKRTESEFAVGILVGIDAGDTLAVRNVMDLICEKVNAIESSYSPDAQEPFDTHEELKILAALHPWLVNYKVTYSTDTQRQAIDTWYCLLIQGKQSRNNAFNGRTTPLPLSDTHCKTIQTGLLNGGIKISEKGTPDEIRDRRKRMAFSAQQLG